MWWLAWKNLRQDKIRLLVSVIGVTFAVVLMLVQTGVYAGYMNSVTAVIDHCTADLWICAAETINANTARPISESEVAVIKGTPGIAWAEKLTYGWAYLTLPDGAGLWAQVAGFNPESGVGGPWEVTQGTTADLKKPGTYIVDESSLAMLRGANVGTVLENFGKRMEIVGTCRGAKPYNTYPIMFASLQTAQDHGLLMDEKTHYIVAGLEPGADRAAVVGRLKQIGRFDVMTRDEFSGRVRDYWATKTGIGMGMGLNMMLGFIVGLVIVGQTMYAATVERLREYATLKAMGATNLQVCQVVWVQVLVIGLVGYALAVFVSTFVGRLFTNTVMSISMGPPLYVLIFVAMLAMCFGASLFSVLRVLRVDPAVGFRA